MRILAIDPGSEESAWVVYRDGQPRDFGKVPNAELLARICPSMTFDGGVPIVLAVEMIAGYGMAVGKEVFDTCVWVGRFVEAWERSTDAIHRHRLVFRKQVKLELCETITAKDKDVRAALLDRYGGKARAIGTRHAPGPLYGMSGDTWSALAVAVTTEALMQRERSR